MIYQPYDMLPSTLMHNGATVDAKRPISFRAKLHGDTPATHWQIIVRAVGSNSITWNSGKVAFSSPFYFRDEAGEAIEFVYTKSFTTEIQNGFEYYWTLLLWWNNNLPPVKSKPCGFMASVDPVVAIINLPSILSSRKFTFLGSYAHADDILAHTFYFELYDITITEKPVLIQRSKRLSYGSKMEYTYDKFFSERVYTIELIVVTDKNETYTSGKNTFFVKYDTLKVETHTKVGTNCFNNSISGEIVDLQAIEGIMTGTGNEYISNAPCEGSVFPRLNLFPSNTLIPLLGSTFVKIGKNNQIVFNTVNGSPMNIVEDNPTFSTMVLITPNIRKIFTISGTDETDYNKPYELSVEYINNNIVYKNNNVIVESKYVPLALYSWLLIVISKTKLMVEIVKTLRGLFPRIDLYPSTTLKPKQGDNY